MKPNKGITLIALVVTIVVLLILAGVTIAMLTGENGIITNAKKAGFETRKEEAREKISVVLEGALIDKQTKPEYNQNEYLDNYVQSYLPDIEITEDEIDLNGFVFELDRSVPKLGEYIGEANNLPPNITFSNITSNSVTINIIRADKATNLKYSYKKHNDSDFVVLEENSKDKTYLLTNLNSNTIYDVEVEVTIDGKVIKLGPKSVLIGEVPSGSIKIKDIMWSSGFATATIYTDEEGYQLEWKKGANGNWSKVPQGVKEVTIPKIENGTEIYARLFDGINSGKEKTFLIEDRQGPKITFNLSESSKLVSELKVSIDYGDSEKKEYKIGNQTYKTYSEEITLNSMDLINNNLINEDKTVTIYARGTDGALNVTEESIVIKNIDLDLPKEPQIISKVGYVTLTANGPIEENTVEIIFDDRKDVENFYSLNNGTTWEKYTGPISIDSGTIKAKSVKNNSGLTVEKTFTITDPKDKLSINAFESSFYFGPNQQRINYKFFIDESLYGKQINISGHNNVERTWFSIYQYGDNGIMIDSTGYEFGYNSNVNRNVEIKEGTKYVTVYYQSGMTYNGFNCTIKVVE